jgi:hypothetical protein
MNFSHFILNYFVVIVGNAVMKRCALRMEN